MNSKQSRRRRFLKNAAALTGLAVGGARTATGQTAEPAAQKPQDHRAYGVRSRFVTSVRGPFPPIYTPLGDSLGTITPAALHFNVGKGDSHTLGPLPDIDPREHRLMIHGMVDRPLIFTMEEIRRLPSVSRVHFLQCAGGAGGSRAAAHIEMFYQGVNQLYWKTSSSEWTGVLLSTLLKEAGVKPGASWVIAEGAEAAKHTRSVPLEKAMTDCIVAYGQNGEPVRPEQGYPLKLVVPAFEGNFNVKWLRRLKVVDKPYMTISESVWYTALRPDGKARWFQFEMPPHSVITFPSLGQQLEGHGFCEIKGLAWSGGGAIRRVEVSVDGGKTYHDAQLQEPVHRIAHTRFRFPWTWNGQEAVIQSRCTDELGQVQPSLAELSEALDRPVDYWQTTTNYTSHVNAIQPWRVKSDGSVQNALFG
jgi:sulfane dehydrogenase subunit SoxC